jgi:hypothetical protein
VALSCEASQRPGRDHCCEPDDLRAAGRLAATIEGGEAVALGHERFAMSSNKPVQSDLGSDDFRSPAQIGLFTGGCDPAADPEAVLDADVLEMGADVDGDRSGAAGSPEAAAAGVTRGDAKLLRHGSDV